MLLLFTSLTALQASVTTVEILICTTSFATIKENSPSVKFARIQVIIHWHIKLSALFAFSFLYLEL